MWLSLRISFLWLGASEAFGEVVSYAHVCFCEKRLAAWFFFFFLFLFLRWYIWSEVMSIGWVAMHDAPIHAVWDWLETPIWDSRLSGTGFRYVRFRYVLCGNELRNMTLQLCEIYLRHTTFHAMWDWLETHDAPRYVRLTWDTWRSTWDTWRSALCGIYLRNVPLHAMWDLLETRDAPHYVGLTWNTGRSTPCDIDLRYLTFRGIRHWLVTQDASYSVRIDWRHF